MCFICKHTASFTSKGAYRRCEYCKSYLVEAIPQAEDIQKVLEHDASSYILGKECSGNSIVYEERLKMIKKLPKRATTALDYGCGSGAFTKFMIKKGYKAYAYDKSKTLRNNLMLQKIPTFENPGNIHNTYFDLITCYDVIEHTAKPKLILHIIKNKLTKDGYLILSTPNARSFSALILGQRWWVFRPDAHFILFSPFSLELILTSCGFSVQKMYTDTLTPWFVPTDNFVSRLLNKIIFLITKPFHSLLFNNYLGDNLVAVCKLK